MIYILPYLNYCSSDNCPSFPETIIIAEMLSVACRGDPYFIIRFVMFPCNISVVFF